MSNTKVFINFEVTEDSHSLVNYRKRGGYQALKKVLEKMSPEAVTEEVKQANLRGRGGAGFPAGVKWSFIKKSEKPVYLCCNADEGEPGTFKDRWLLENNPHQLIEGMLIAAFAIGVKYSFIYIRGEFDLSYRRIVDAVEEAYANNLLGAGILGTDFSCHMAVHQGAGSYVCGDETALIHSLEGFKGYPKIKPPFPAVSGLYKSPTIVNNVETLAAVPWVIANGGPAYKAMGVGKSNGTKLFSVSGHINKPGVYELELGYPFKTFFEKECGGMLYGKKLKAVIPGGSSTPVLRSEEILECNMDYESLQAKGSSLGSGAVIVIAEGTCMVKLLYVTVRFYRNESCGQCTPCREGVDWMERILARLVSGKGEEGDDVQLKKIANSIMGRTICPLGDAAAMPVIGFVDKYKDEFLYAIKNKKLMFGGNLECLK
ncbi:NADH-quinone oxidoreductase subunit NuoF [Deltaproteobacteria bacterium TL4]